MMDYLGIIASCDLEFGQNCKLNELIEDNKFLRSRFSQPFIQVVYVLCLYWAQISGERLQDHWSSG